MLKENSKRYRLRKRVNKLIEETESDQETKECIEKLMLCLKKRHQCFDECSNNNKKGRCFDNTPEMSLMLDNTKQKMKKIKSKHIQKVKKVSL